MLASLVATPTPTWIGSAPTWLLLVMALIVAWRVTKGGGGSAVTELSKANEVLEQRLSGERKERLEDQARINELMGKTDVVLAVTPIIAHHELMAIERHKAVTDVLGAMTTTLEQLAKRLDPDTPSGL